MRTNVEQEWLIVGIMDPVVIPRDFTIALAVGIQQNTPGKEPVQRE